MHHDIRTINLKLTKNRPGFIPKNSQPVIRPRGAWYYLIGTTCLLITVAVTGLTVVLSQTLAHTPPPPAPIVTLANMTSQAVAMEYGPNQLLSQKNFYVDTVATFKEQKVDFIEANLSTMQIRYHQEGEIIFSAPILTKGREGSWWETPAGLYKVETMSQKHRSSFGNVDTPWNLVFQGNFFIHGWPSYPNGEPVTSTYSGGCIRLSNEHAQELYALVERNTPVLVYEDSYQGDDFHYSLTPPTIDAAAFLVADVKSGALLMEHNATKTLPIASITKLMTALVATEYINLDRDIQISPNHIATTSVPRLYEGQIISNYSLLLPLLKESSNEAASALASNLGMSRFVEIMNKKATSIGMNDTVFADVSGINNRNTSNALDLLQLATYIYHNRLFVFSVSSDSKINTLYKVYPFAQLKNFNVVPDLENLLGGKVGKTVAAKETILAVYNIPIAGQNRPIAFIVLGSEDNYKDVQSLHAFVVHTYGNNND